MLTKNSRYGIHIFENSKFICIDFDFSPIREHEKSCLFQTCAPALEHEFTKLFHLWNKKTPNRLPQIYSVLYALYAQATDCLNKGYTKKNAAISQITSYILAHYTEPPFGVQNVAEHFGISQTHLRRLFHQTFQLSPMGYIHHLQLNKAKKMMQVSNYTINEIALSAGFQDPYYFSRFFKKETGLSPTEYKKQQANH